MKYEDKRRKFEVKLESIDPTGVVLKLNRNYTLVLTVDALRCTKGISANGSQIN